MTVKVCTAETALVYMVHNIFCIQSTGSSCFICLLLSRLQTPQILWDIPASVNAPPSSTNNNNKKHSSNSNSICVSAGNKKKVGFKALLTPSTSSHPHTQNQLSAVTQSNGSEPQWTQTVKLKVVKVEQLQNICLCWGWKKRLKRDTIQSQRRTMKKSDDCVRLRKMRGDVPAVPVSTDATIQRLRVHASPRRRVEGRAGSDRCRHQVTDMMQRDRAMSHRALSEFPRLTCSSSSFLTIYSPPTKVPPPLTGTGEKKKLASF